MTTLEEEIREHAENEAERRAAEAVRSLGLYPDAVVRLGEAEHRLQTLVPLISAAIKESMVDDLAQQAIEAAAVRLMEGVHKRLWQQ